MSDPRIWAKSNGTTLKKHNSDLLDQFKKLWELLEKKLPEEVDKETLKRLVELAIVKHDLGKFLPSFQKQLGNREYAIEVEKLFLEAPHSLVSVLFELEGEERLTEEQQMALNSAVAYHHYRERFDALITSPKTGVHETAEELMKDEKWRNRVLSSLKKEIPPEFEIKGINEPIAIFLQRNGAIAEVVPPPYKMRFFLHREMMPAEVEKLRFWTAGLLQRVDHFASFLEEEKDEELRENEQTPQIEKKPSSAEKDEKEIKIEKEPPSAEEVEKKIEEEITKKGGKLWQKALIDQEALKEIEKVIFVAPTGSGKTEFALLWGGGTKVIYTLPLRSAVNQIFERIKKIFGDENAGLLHSDADLYLLENFGNLEEEDAALANAIKTYETTRHLAYPAIVSTGDQFFPYALKPPLYERIYTTAAISSFVIDEIQAYDPKAMAIVVKFVEEITNLGGRALIITATLPKFVKSELKKLGFEVINLYGQYDEEEEKEEAEKFKEFRKFFQNFVKHRYKLLKVNKDLAKDEGLINRIVGEAEKGKRVLVVVNTIGDAEKLYEALNGKFEKLYKFHSELILKERKELEELLKKEFSNPKPANEKEGKILVATQVVEASLDIDADVLFTVLAPLDALVQRMGRVARRYSFVVEDYEKKQIKVIDKSKNELFNLDKNHPFNAFENYNNNAPNVFILIKENEKGHWILDKIYPKEVLELTGLILVGLEKDRDIINKWQEYQKWKEEQEQKVKPKKQNAKNKQKTLDENETLNEALNHIDELVFYVLFTQDEIIISEYDKQQKLQKLFELLEKKENSKYIEEFRKTLKIIEGGYFSGSRTEAQRIFREIYSVQVVKKEDFDKFKEALKEFVQNYPEGKKSLYTLFKEEIAANFFIPMGLWKAQKHYNLKNLYSELENDLNEILPEGLSEENRKKWLKRLQRWLRGVYLLDDKVDYSEEGLVD